MTEKRGIFWAHMNDKLIASGAKAIGSRADTFCSGVGDQTGRADFSSTEPTRGSHQDRAALVREVNEAGTRRSGATSAPSLAVKSCP